MNHKIIKLAALVLLLAGMGILTYPAISSAINRYLGSYAIQSLKQEIEHTDSDTMEQERQKAEQYNAQLLINPLDVSEAEYLQTLDFQDSMMGYIQIPDVQLDLPIYHGVSEKVLAKGVGHLPSSAFPIGGVGNHTVLTGHTGLPSAELFTDLTELTEGDVFYIHVLGGVLRYQIDQIRVVLPEETQNLMPVAGKDLCTLVTCTPYGINSHRLLVRGIRAELQEFSPERTQPIPSPPWGMLLLTVILLAGYITTIAVLWGERRR